MLHSQYSYSCINVPGPEQILMERVVRGLKALKKKILLP